MSSADEAALRRELAAQRRTIDVLLDRVEGRGGTTGSALDTTLRMAGLEQVVQRRTDELAEQKAALESTLVALHETQSQLVSAQKLEAVGQLAAGIAHEINTPMQYIGDNARFLDRAFTELLALADRLDPTVLDDAARRRLGLLRTRVPRALTGTIEGVDNVARIVQALKEFSHPGGGERAPCDLNHCVISTVAVSRNEWKYVAEVDTELAPNLPPVDGLRSELGQVLLNILVNAAHAIADHNTALGRERGRIEIRTSFDDQVVRITVSDDGPGIPPAIQARVFDPFFTTKPVGRGTGQGLAIARSIVVDKHGGTLEVVCPAPGRDGGTCFTITLPRSPDPGGPP